MNEPKGSCHRRNHNALSCRDNDLNNDPAQQEYIYVLQDANSDLQKRIHSLEITFRDKGFDKDGLIPQNNNCDGATISIATGVEMMSMMGMDPEKPTVLTKYLEFKVLELQEENETIESECEELRSIVRNYTKQIKNAALYISRPIISNTSSTLSAEENRRDEAAVDNICTLLSNSNESLKGKKEAQMKEQIENDESSKMELILQQEACQSERKIETNESLNGKGETRMKEQIEKLHRQLTDVIDKSSEKELILQQEAYQLETKIEEMQSNSIHIGDLKRDIEVSTERNKNEQDHLNNIIVNLKKDHQTIIQKNDNKCEHLANRVLELEKELDATVEESAEKNKIEQDRLNNIIVELEKQYQINQHKNEKKYEHLTNRILESEKEVDATTNENETLKESLANYIAEVEAKKESDFKSIQKKNESEIMILSGRCVTLEKEVQDCKNDNERMSFLVEEKKQSLAETIDEESRKKNVLREEYSILKQDTNKYIEENRKLSIQNETLSMASVAVKEKNDQEKISLTCRVAELEHEIISISETNAKEQEHFKNDITDLNKTLELVTKKNESLSCEIELSKAQKMIQPSQENDSSFENLNDDKEQATQLKEQLNVCQKDSIELQGTQSGAMHKLEEQEASFAQISEETDSSQEKLQADKELEERLNVIRELQDTISSTKSKLNEQEVVSIQLFQEKEALQTNLSEMVDICAAKDSSLELLQSEEEQATQEVEEHKEEIELLKFTLLDTQKQLKEFESTVEKSGEEQKSAMIHVIHLTKEIDLREQKIESLSSENELFEAVKVKNKQEQEFLTCRIVKLEQEEQNSKTAQNLFLQQVATLEDSLESANINNRSLSSQIKLHEEQKAEQIELHEADKVKIEQEQEFLMCRITELEQEERNNRTEQDLFLQQVVALKNDLESVNIDNRNLSSQIKSYEEKKGEQIELYEADKVKNKQEQEFLTRRIVELEQEEQNNKTRQDLFLQEAADLKNDLESTNTKNLSLSSQIKSYEEVNGEHERFADRVSNLENELQSSLERNDQLSIDIESFRIIEEEHKHLTERVSHLIQNNSRLEKELQLSVQNNTALSFKIQDHEAKRDSLKSMNLVQKREGEHGNIQHQKMASLTTKGSLTSEERIEKYLYQLVDKAEIELDQEIPNDIIQGIYDALLVRTERESSSIIDWEELESILEEVCQEYDEKTWFQIQEAFFAALEVDSENWQSSTHNNTTQ